VQALRTIYRFWAALVFLAVLVQVGAAGYGAFNAADKADPGPLTEDQFSSGFDFHDGFGYLIFLAVIVLALLAVGGRFGRRLTVMNLVLLALLVVQVLLAWGGESTPAIGIFHPINAFLIVGLSGRLSYEAWWGMAREPAVESRATPSV
jgi:hypothetical protein